MQLEIHDNSSQVNSVENTTLIIDFKMKKYKRNLNQIQVLGQKSTYMTQMCNCSHLAELRSKLEICDWSTTQASPWTSAQSWNCLTSQNWLSEVVYNDNFLTRRHSKLQVSFGPKANSEVAWTFARREWKSPGVQPYKGQQVSADTTRWQTAPKPSAESG